MGANMQSFVMPDPAWVVTAQNLPKAGTLVKYRTASYQCLGYMNVSGRWVDLDGTEEPRRVESWRTIHDEAPRWPERD
jgi:hypothetical protein